MEAWHYWLIAGLLLIILEIFTPGFVLASFGIGCFAAGLSASFGMSFYFQIFLFSAGTLLVFFGIRPLFKKYLLPPRVEEPTNVAALEGKSGRVTETVDNNNDSGRVKIGGEDWRAVAEDNQVYKEGETVQTIRVEGTKVFVKKV